MRMGFYFIGLIIAAAFVRMALGQDKPGAKAKMSESSARALVLIKAALEKADKQPANATMVSDLKTATEEVTRTASANVLVKLSLDNALKESAGKKSDKEAVSTLRRGLIETRDILTFEPYMEAPLPEGFPELTPLGEIQVKSYPAYRMARTAMKASDSTAFWTLFTHIKNENIAMTAPVEMTYGKGKDTAPESEAMAFLYRSVTQGETGNHDKVEVVDVPPMTALSIGLRGTISSQRIAEAREFLDGWLKQHADEYEASGSLRVLGYNSPFNLPGRRFSEVQIPVRQKAAR